MNMSELKNEIEFPPVERADEDGVLAISLDIDNDFLLSAYSNGIFPWPVEEELIYWFAPPQRAVLFFDELRINRSLRRTLNKSQFTFAVNKDFENVIRACAAQERAGQNGTWITSKIIDAYIEFHKAGHAWSFESYNRDGRLVGGMYGVMLGKYFAGESMFFIETGASKFAFVEAVRYLQKLGFEWLDAQVVNPFLESFGVKEIAREHFMRMLRFQLTEKRKICT